MAAYRFPCSRPSSQWWQEHVLLLPVWWCLCPEELHDEVLQPSQHDSGREDLQLQAVQGRMLLEILKLIMQACVCLHNLMRMRYPGLQNAAMDIEDDNHQVVDGAWRTRRNMQDVHNVRGPNRDTRAAKAQREYLQHYISRVRALAEQHGTFLTCGDIPYVITC